ncbi:hypothetical protein NFI96_017242, partial [Prochilodus magdalenae]
AESAAHRGLPDSCFKTFACFTCVLKGIAAMGKGCITATKYFLFLFNLLFFIFGALIMSFGLWVLLDNQSFIAVLQESSTTLKVGAYILIGVGSLSMLMGFLGCIGAIYEIRCLLGLYFTCLLLILIAQVTAAVLIYFQRDLLRHEISTIVNKILVNYTGQNKTSEHAWDYLQRTIHCCGWIGPSNWTENVWIKNSTQTLYPCSCRNESIPGTELQQTGLCQSLVPEWPVYTKLVVYVRLLVLNCLFCAQGCMSSVEDWLLSNCGVILGVCIGVAVIEVHLISITISVLNSELDTMYSYPCIILQNERATHSSVFFFQLLGMLLSMCLCKSVHQEVYTKVPKY